MEAPLAAADVRNPDRSEWAENFSGFRPARAAFRLTIIVTARPLSRLPTNRPDLVIARKIGPSLIRAAFNQANIASVGQSVIPLGIATIVPSASWSVLDRDILTSRPFSVASISATSRPASSDRRRAPAKPRRTMERSRSPAKVDGADCAIALARSAVAGVLRLRATPTVRRIPRKVALTCSALVGGSWPAP